MKGVILTDGSVECDRVPELVHYEDSGCKYYVSCLGCPFSACLYEDPHGTRHARNQQRDAAIGAAVAGGERIEAVAARFGIVPRSVYRVAGPAVRPLPPPLPARWCAACASCLVRRAGEGTTQFSLRRTCGYVCAGALRRTRTPQEPLPVACVICSGPLSRPTRTCSGSCARRLMWASRPRKEQR